MISISSIIISGVFVFQFLGLHFHGGTQKRIHLYPSRLAAIQSEVSERMRQIEFRRAFYGTITGFLFQEG